MAALRQRVVEMEEENTELRDLVDEQALRLEALARRVAELEDHKPAGEAAGIVDADDANSHKQSDNIGRGWRPPRHRPGMPDAGVVTLQEQSGEEFAFGPSVALEAEWRRLRTADGQSLSHVDRSKPAVRRWALEAELLGDYHLTLPPDTYPLDNGRRADHVRWRRDALAEARRELAVPGAPLLRRVVTLGFWRQ